MQHRFNTEPTRWDHGRGEAEAACRGTGFLLARALKQAALALLNSQGLLAELTPSPAPVYLHQTLVVFWPAAGPWTRKKGVFFSRIFFCCCIITGRPCVPVARHPALLRRQGGEHGTSARVGDPFMDPTGVAGSPRIEALVRRHIWRTVRFV